VIEAVRHPGGAQRVNGWNPSVHRQRGFRYAGNTWSVDFSKARGHERVMPTQGSPVLREMRVTGSVSLKNEHIDPPALAFLRSSGIGMQPSLAGQGQHRREGLALRIGGSVLGM